MKKGLDKKNEDLINFMTKLAKDDKLFDEYVKYIKTPVQKDKLKNLLKSHGLADEFINFFVEKDLAKLRSHIKSLNLDIPFAVYII